MVVRQYEVFFLSLDPSFGHEIKKTRPCVIVSPDELNDHLATVIVAPLTTKSHPYPTRLPVKFNEKNGWIALDQIRTIDKKRLIKRMGSIDVETIKRIKAILKEFLVD